MFQAPGDVRKVDFLGGLAAGVRRTASQLSGGETT